MPLNANALTTLDRCKGELDITAGDTDQDTQIEDYINSVSDAIELATNRRFYQDSYVHRLSGNGLWYIPVEQFPVVTLTKVAVDYKWGFGAETELGIGVEVAVDKDIFLVRRSPASPWPKNQPMNIEVTYEAGYGGATPAPSDMPDGIQQAAVEWVRYLYNSQNDRRLGRTSMNKLGENVSWDATQLPPLVAALVEPYKRENVIKRGLALLGVGTTGVEKQNSDNQ